MDYYEHMRDGKERWKEFIRDLPDREKSTRVSVLSKLYNIPENKVRIDYRGIRKHFIEYLSLIFWNSLFTEENFFNDLPKKINPVDIIPNYEDTEYYH